MPDTEQLTIQNYRLWLVDEWDKRRRKNPSYSLKAFSQSLGISAPSLSQVLSGKRPLSRKAALKIIHSCALTPEEAKAFLSSALGVDDGPKIEPVDPEGKRYVKLDLDTFRLIADWKHYAILSLAAIRPNHADPKWIATRLGITLPDAEDAFTRLLQLGLIKRKGSRFFQTSKSISIGTERSTSIFRKYHRQTLHKAMEALDKESTQLEYYSSIVMAIDENRLSQARGLIKNFRRQLCELLETGSREAVYTIAVQLFPICKKEGTA